MKTPVKRDDFEIRDNEVVHKPTGARFSAYPGSKATKSVNWGRADEVLESGANYDRDEILRCAEELLSKRKFS